MNAADEDDAFARIRTLIGAVAREAKRGDVGANRVDADWPSPAKTAAACVPIAVLQSGSAAMSKDGAFSSSGVLARDVENGLANEFVPTTIDETGDPCAQIGSSVIGR